MYKHAMHLTRLLITGIDILDGKGIVAKRAAEHDFLMDIRRRRYSFDEIKRLAGEYREKFRRAAERTAVEALVLRIYQTQGNNKKRQNPTI